jgi:hypothetical protein
MTPLLLGAAWLMFVVSCMASIVPVPRPTQSPAHPEIKAKAGGRDDETP